MSELFAAIASWQSLASVLLVFGFLPGSILRLVLWLCYPKDDPRRRELIAELYGAVPRIERPLWVAEQIEVALFEGLPHRLRKLRARRARHARPRRRWGPIRILIVCSFLGSTVNTVKDAVTIGPVAAGTMIMNEPLTYFLDRLILLLGVAIASVITIVLAQHLQSRRRTLPSEITNPQHSRRR